MIGNASIDVTVFRYCKNNLLEQKYRIMMTYNI